MTTITALRPTTTTLTIKPAPKRNAATRRRRQQAIAGTAIGAVALTLVGLSLTHLARGIAIVTLAPAWEAWAMAVGIDLGFVALETAALGAATDKLRRAIARWTRPGIIGTLLASAILNAFAFASQSVGWYVGPAIALGVAIPALVYALTRVGMAMWVDYRAE